MLTAGPVIEVAGDAGKFALTFATVAVFAQRSKSQGGSRLMALFLFVPLFNIVYVWTCLVRQPDYEDTGQLDRVGAVLNKYIAAMVILVSFLIVVLLGFQFLYDNL